MDKIRVFKTIWLENNWDRSEQMCEELLEIEASCMNYTAESGDQIIDIGVENDNLEQICSILIESEIISTEQKDEVIDLGVEIITLY